MSSTVNGIAAVAVFAPAAADRPSVYWPFSRPGGGVKLNVCVPAGFVATSSVESTCPAGETSVAVTVAGAVSV